MSAADRPVVTFIICTRNRADRLGGTLESLRAIRSDIPWEAIIVDNASTDDTAAVIGQWTHEDRRLRYLLVTRIGLGAGRAAGWQEAKGEIVSFTDDDCYVKPDYVDQIVRVFAEHPRVGVVGGRILLHDPNDARITIDERTEPRHYPARTFIGAGALHGANLSFRKEALQQSGGFDPGLGAGTPFPCEDIDAVAAVTWAGWDARYDARPTVSHHHMRKQADVPALQVGYDAGRGAYFAKYIMRRDTRAAYARAWLARANRDRSLATLKSSVGEYGSGVRYARHEHRPVWAATMALFGGLALAYAGARAVLASGLRRAG